jgi:hypothetical protein
MNTNRHPTRLALITLCAAVASFGALASVQTEAAAQHKREVAACSNVAKEDRAACLEDAFVAYREARRGVLGDGMAVDSSNLTKRCDALKGADRLACVARMQGQGTTSGSVAAGGIYRELVIVQPASEADKPAAETK